MVLVVAAEDEVIASINEEFPHDQFSPIAARSWTQVSESLGSTTLAAAIVHHKLLDIGSLDFCRKLRATPGRSKLPIILLLPGVGRLPSSKDPFSIAMLFPAGPGVLADNLVKVVSENDLKLAHLLAELKSEITSRLSRIDEKNYYQILDIPHTATREEIIHAYDNFSLRFHPDRLKKLREDSDVFAGASRFYLLVTEAYQTLLDITKRKRYNEGLQFGKLRYDPSLYQTLDDLSRVSDVDNARRYLRLAQKELDRGDTKAAAVFLKMARAVDPDNAEIERRLELLQSDK